MYALEKKSKMNTRKAGATSVTEIGTRIDSRTGARGGPRRDRFLRAQGEVLVTQRETGDDWRVDVGAEAVDAHWTYHRENRVDGNLHITATTTINQREYILRSFYTTTSEGNGYWRPWTVEDGINRVNRLDVQRVKTLMNGLDTDDEIKELKATGERAFWGDGDIITKYRAERGAPGHVINGYQTGFHFG